MSGTGSIPATDIVTVTPGVLNAGGTALDLIGILLTTSAHVPIGDIHSFPDADSVAAYFGDSSPEAAAAVIYFLGFDNSDQKPGSVLFAQYNTSNVSAYLRGGDVSGLTLAQLQAITGNLSITIDGFVFATGSPIDLSSATSFSNAATIIATALDALAPGPGSFTASAALAPDGNGGRLNVTAVASGIVAGGQTLHGASVVAGTLITGQVSGTTGGIGIYSLDTAQVISSEAMTATSPSPPTVTYDSVSGGFVITSGNHGNGSTIGFGSNPLATKLLLTQALGAVTSQGARTATPQAFMDAIKVVTQDWATFTHLFDPDSGSGNTQKLFFAEWTNAQNNRYAYIPWDTDAAPSASNNATTSLGNILKNLNSSGTAPFWGPDNTKAIMACGSAASIDFTATEGRITFKFKSQTGLTPDVTDAETANNLRANGYNFYGQWATANQQFQGIADGTVSGPFQWLDSYVNQIWLNNALQLALMELLFTLKSIPYNTAGYGLMEAACADPIAAALNSGVIRTGITLSSLQKASINTSAGVDIADTIQAQGYYLQVKDASPQVRQARGTPPSKFWYTDGGSIQQINLASITIQ